MATVTLSTFGNFVAGTTPFGDGQVITRAGADADTCNLPASAPIGMKVFFCQDGAGTLTIGAGTGATVVGNTTLVADNVVVMAYKNTATEWVCGVAE